MRPLDAAADLLLGARCVGCSRPGRLVCRGCEAALPDDAHVAWPTPAPPGLATPWAAAEYAGVVRSMVVGHKEDRLLALRGSLALLLARAVAAGPPAGPLVLVPVPSRPASVRARGYDPTYALTARAAALLRGAGHDVVAQRLLRTRPGVVDQAGLDADARSRNLAGSMCCPTTALRRVGRNRPRARFVVCDDVLTTGATAREAQRALESVGLEVPCVAVVAATRRRLQPGPAGSLGDSSGPRVSPRPNTH